MSWRQWRQNLPPRARRSCRGWRFRRCSACCSRFQGTARRGLECHWRGSSKACSRRPPSSKGFWGLRGIRARGNALRPRPGTSSARTCRQPAGRGTGGHCPRCPPVACCLAAVNFSFFHYCTYQSVNMFYWFENL